MFSFPGKRSHNKRESNKPQSAEHKSQVIAFRSNIKIKEMKTCEKRLREANLAGEDSRTEISQVTCKSENSFEPKHIAKRNL